MADIKATETLATGKPKSTQFRIISISLYEEDVQLMEELVRELKRRGHTNANRSLLIRAAIRQVNLDKVPKSRRHRP